MFARLSLRLRLLLALACAVVPFAAVLVFANLWIYRPMADDVQLLSDRIQQRFEEITGLQLLVARSAMPPNDYLIHRRDEERIRFQLMATRIDSALKALRRDTSEEHPPELRRLEEMEQRWQRARSMGLALFEWPPDAELALVAKAMESFDSEIDRLTEDAESLLAHVRAELEEVRDRAIRRRHDLNRFVGLSTATAGILTLIMVMWLARGLVGPLGSARGAARARAAPPAADASAAGVPGGPSTVAAPAVDAVTRLWTRRSLQEQLGIETERAMVLETPSSVAIALIDGFETLREGLSAGELDGVLVALAERLRHVIRQTDFPARSGEGEFAVLMPATDLACAFEIAERIREHIVSKPIAVNHRQLAVTVSIGVAGDAAARGGHAGASTLLGRADQAMHRARRAGGNRVERSGGGLV